MVLDLNNPNNLNPDIPKAFPDGTAKLSLPDKKKVMKEWNNKPYIKQNKIKAVDISEFEIIKKVAYIGVGAAVVIAIAFAVFAYIAWEDGTLQDPAMICGNTTIGFDEGSVQCGACDPTFTCPDCNAECDLTGIGDRFEDIEDLIDELDLNCT